MLSSQTRLLTVPLVLLALLAALVLITRSGGHSNSPTSLVWGIGEEEVYDNAAKTATKQGALEMGITPLPVDSSYLDEVPLSVLVFQ